MVAESSDWTGLGRCAEAPMREHAGRASAETSSSEPSRRDRQGRCGLCGNSLPSDLLTAAHIKPRSACSAAERVDAPWIVMPACLIGCDALFELGYLGVGDLGALIPATDCPIALSSTDLRLRGAASASRISLGTGATASGADPHEPTQRPGLRLIVRLRSLAFGKFLIDQPALCEESPGCPSITQRGLSRHL